MKKTKDTYCFNIPKGGSGSLEILDYCFNQSTSHFLLESGLSKGMKVLELGCGSGKMSCFIAEKIGVQGQLFAIDNNEYQLNTAKKYADRAGVKNVYFRRLNAYDISQLNTKFDMVYCRFLLHHLSRPRQVIHDVHEVLKSGGVVAIEEGIVNNAFVYPYNIAFGNERFSILDHHENFENINRDGNFGIKLYYCLYQGGFTNLSHHIVAPTLRTKMEKSLLKPGFIEGKNHALQSGITENEWQGRLVQLDKLIEDDSAIVGFYQSVQVSGKKP